MNTLYCSVLCVSVHVIVYCISPIFLFFSQLSWIIVKISITLAGAKTPYIIYFNVSNSFFHNLFFKVVLIEPYFDCYGETIRSLGAKARCVPLRLVRFFIHSIIYFFSLPALFRAIINERFHRRSLVALEVMQNLCNIFVLFFFYQKLFFSTPPLKILMKIEF